MRKTTLQYIIFTLIGIIVLLAACLAASWRPSFELLISLLLNIAAVFVGVGLPNLACNLAQRTHAPNLVMIYEAGVIGGGRIAIPRRSCQHFLSVKSAAS